MDEQLDAHPDFDCCYTHLVTDMMSHDAFMEHNKQRFACLLGPKQPPRTARLIRKKKTYKSRLVSQKLLEANATLSAIQWEVPSAEALMKSDLSRFVYFAATDCGFDGFIEALVVNWLHPLMLTATSKGNHIDNLNWMQAMNGPFSREYLEAACVEVETMEKMDAWPVQGRTKEMNVLPLTWAFKCKHYSNDLIKKFKA